MVVFRCALDDSDESCSADEGSPAPVRKNTPFVIRRLNRSGFGPIERPRATPMKPPSLPELVNRKDGPANNTRVKRGYGVPEYDSDLSDESDTDEQRARSPATLCDPFLSTHRTTSVPATKTALFSSSRSPPSVSPAKKVTFLNPLGKLEAPLSLPKSSDVTLSKLLEGLEFSSDVSRSKSQLPHCAPKSRSTSRSPGDPRSESAKKNAAAVKATLALRVTTHEPHPAKVEARKKQCQKSIEGRFLELRRVAEAADQHASDHVKQIVERHRQLDEEVVPQLQRLQLEGERQIALQGNAFDARDKSMKKRHAEAMAKYREEEALKAREAAERRAKEQAEKEAKEASERAEQEARAKEAAERAAEEQRKVDSEIRAANEEADRVRAQQAESALVSRGAREEAEPYLQLMKHLKEDVIPNEKRDKPTHDFCVQRRRDLTKRICQITDNEESIHLATREVNRVLKEGKEMNDVAYRFLMYNAAKTAIGCVERNGMKETPPIARMCLNVMKANQDFTRYFMARLIKKCPYAVPRYGGQEDHEVQTRKAKGYKEGETFDTFLSRMRSMIQLYAAIMTLEPLATPGSHPHGMEHAWRWLSRFCNLRPLEHFSGSLMDAFLSVAATPLLNRYGVQFLKVLAFLRTDYASDLLRMHDARIARPYADFILTNVQRFEEQGVYPADKDA